MTSNIAISYARFSSGVQAKGDSFRRQTEASEKYAAEHGLILDKSLTYSDLGVSAFDRSNIRKGELGLLLQAVKEGKIPEGATLIVESLDRLSRADPWSALGIFTEIIQAGLTLVTLGDGQVYSRGSIDGQKLILSISVMQRAHEESAIKSRRGIASWEQKRKVAISEGVLMSRRAPAWIDVRIENGIRTASLNPDREPVVMKIIEMAERGIGNATIIRKLHAETIPAWSKTGRWQPSYIQKMLDSIALYGAIELKNETVENYYPAIIDKSRFYYLKSLRSARATRKTTNRKGRDVTNLFSGLLKCGYCGSACNIGGYKSLKSGYQRKYVACQGARTGATSCRMHTWFLDELEPKILFWLTTLDIEKIVGEHRYSDAEKESALLVELERQKVHTARKIENIISAIEEGGKSLVPKLHALEFELSSVDEEIKIQTQRIAALALTPSGSSRMKWIALLFRKLKLATDPVELRLLREQLSASIASIVEKIVLYPLGHNARETREDRFIDIELKDGTKLRIDPGEC